MDLSITLFLHFAIMRLTVYSTFNVKHTVFSSTWVNVLSHFKPWKKQTLPGGQGQEHLLPRDTSVGTRCRDEHCCCGRSLVGPDGHLNYPVWGADLWIHFETIFTIWTLSVRQRSFSLQLPSRFTPTATSRSSRNVSARGFISPRYPSFCQSRCFYLCVSFLFSNGRYLILEWSSSFGAGVSDRTEWGGGGKGEGRLNPRRPAPDSGHKPVRVYISPPPEFRKIGEINAVAEGWWCWWRFQMASGFGGGGVGASQRGLRPQPRLYESCKIASGLRPGPSQQQFGTPCYLSLKYCVPPQDSISH